MTGSYLNGRSGCHLRTHLVESMSHQHVPTQVRGAVGIVASLSMLQHTCVSCGKDWIWYSRSELDAVFAGIIDIVLANNCKI